MPDVTQILSRIEAGDPSAAEQLLPLVYDELRRMAAQQLAHEKPGQTPQATALVHEAYLRLVDATKARNWNGCDHFFAVAAACIRRILIDNARRKRSQKHGGGWQRLKLEDIEAPQPDDDLLALDEALKRLTTKDPIKAKLVELRYFGGLTGDEAASVLGISPTTADRHWAYARAWLKAEIRGG